MSLTTVKKLQYLSTLTPDFYKFLKTKTKLFENCFYNYPNESKTINNFFDNLSTYDLIEFQPLKQEYDAWDNARIDLEKEKFEFEQLKNSKKEADYEFEEYDDFNNESDDLEDEAKMRILVLEEKVNREYSTLLDVFRGYFMFDEKTSFDVIRCDEIQYDLIVDIIQNKNDPLHNCFKYVKVVICHHAGDYEKERFKILPFIPLYFFVGKKLDNGLSNIKAQSIIVNENEKIKNSIYVKIQDYELPNGKNPIQYFLGILQEDGNIAPWRNWYPIFFNSKDKDEEMGDMLGFVDAKKYCEESEENQTYINYDFVDRNIVPDAKFIEYSTNGFRNNRTERDKIIMSISVKPGDKLNYVTSPYQNQKRVVYVHGTFYSSNLSSTETYLNFVSGNGVLSQHSIKNELKNTIFIFSDMTKADLEMVTDINLLENYFTREDFEKRFPEHLILLHDYTKFFSGKDKKTALEIENDVITIKNKDNEEIPVDITQLEDFFSRLTLKHRHFGRFGSFILKEMTSSLSENGQKNLAAKTAEDKYRQIYENKTPEEKMELMRKIFKANRLKDKKTPYASYPFIQEVVKISSEEKDFERYLKLNETENKITNFYFSLGVKFIIDDPLPVSILISNKKFLFLDVSNFTFVQQADKKIFVQDIDLLVIFSSTQPNIGNHPIINVSGKIHSLVLHGNASLIFDNISPRNLSIISGEFDKFIDYPDDFSSLPASQYSIDYFVKKENEILPAFSKNIKDIIANIFSSMDGCKKLNSFKDYPRARTIIKNLYVKTKNKRWGSTSIENVNREK